MNEAVKLIMDRTDTNIYWGNNTTDLAAISKFPITGEISVEVFGTLSEKQYRALGVIGK